MSDDGRHIDVQRSRLAGFGAGMAVESTEQAWPLEPAREKLPVPAPTAQAEQAIEGPSYYGMPVVKPPPWKWYIPAYIYVGGAAGAAATMAAAAQLSGDTRLSGMVRDGRWMAVSGYMAGASLLIADLGRPSRFLNMLRVFRPTSPMNMGTWLLSGASAAAAVAAFGPKVGLGKASAAGGLISGLLGPLMTTYTGVLLANTAMPLWKEQSRGLPIVFGASAAASAASLYELCCSGNAHSHRVSRTFSIAAKTAELVAAHSIERSSQKTRAGQVLRRGRTGRTWRSATILGLASLATTVLFGKSRAGRMVAGALGTASAVALKTAVVEGGKESARDPQATFANSEVDDPRRDT